VAVALLAVAFTVGEAEPLVAPRLEPSFDQTTAVALTTELARQFPDRAPGSAGAAKATDWVAARFDEMQLTPHRDAFDADLPGLGRRNLVNLIAVVPGRSPATILTVAHRDNSGMNPGANDNASGTGALLELARNAQLTRPAHTLVFLSTDGGAFGVTGAARFAESPQVLRRLVGTAASVVGVVSLDAIASGEAPRLLFAGDAARSPAPTLVATADESVTGQLEETPRRPSALAQLVDLAFPFTLHEQGPFVAEGTPAVTLTTGGERPPAEAPDTLEALDRDQLGSLGRSAQDMLLRLDAAAELAGGTQSYLYLSPRIVRGWAIQFVLLAALLPFLVATVDLFARCRRRRIPLAPGLRSFASRLGVWLWGGAVFAALALAGLFAEGGARPLNMEVDAATAWPTATLAVLAFLALVGWLVARPRLVRRRRVTPEEELGGHLAAMLVLALVALVVAATNPYSLLFVLPSLHAWLWLPHVPRGSRHLRLTVFAAGFAGLVILVGSFAFRYGLGLDAVPYLVALTSVGYVAPPLLLAALVWGAAAAQVGAIALGRYAPYPDAGDRPARGPIRETIRRVVLFSRGRRRAATGRGEEPALRSVDEFDL
jgi:Peptidase family M28